MIYAWNVLLRLAKGGDKTVAENIIASIEIRRENKAYPKEIIPIRVLEIGEVNSAYEWASSTIKKQLTKDFSSQEEDIEKIQEVMDSGRSNLNSVWLGRTSVWLLAQFWLMRWKGWNG